jgi:capsular polysaccharide biosynthesis protein
MGSVNRPLATIEHPRWFPGLRGRVTLYASGPPSWYREKFEERIENLRVIEGFPDPVLEVRSAYFIPGSVCLYDQDGRRIDASCVRRKPAQWNFVGAGPDTIDVPHDCARLPAPMLYVAELASHWGHFLTDGVSRLWARSVFPELRELDCFSAAAIPDLAPARDYLHALGIARRIHFSPEPVRLDTCFIPAASFSDRGECYTAHLHSFREVTASVAAEQSAWAPSRRPVYLSRSQFGVGRTIRCERQLEERLADRGVLIVHPEQLSLEEQIRVFNSHDVFIGCWGSAFHGLCFARAPERITTHVLCETIPNPNFLLFDAILGCASNYIQGLSETPGPSQQWPNFDLTVDVERVLGYLRDRSCI